MAQHQLQCKFCKFSAYELAHDFMSKINKFLINVMVELPFLNNQGPVVQSIVSLTGSLRGQLKCLTTLCPNTPIFFVERMKEAFALQKLLTLFQQKILVYFRY